MVSTHKVLREGGYRTTANHYEAQPKYSIVTVVYNGDKYIEDTILSVIAQDFDSIEHIIVDGGSTDKTVEILEKYSDKIAYWISEPDKGIYDGMNKGIELAQGKYVGILNSDDYYESSTVIERVEETFQEYDPRCVFAHVKFINPINNKTVRIYNSKSNPEKLFKWGFMPAHPTFFAHREDYIKYGLYKEDYKIAADYELLIRFLYRFKLTYKKLDKIIIVMRIGGASTGGIKSTLLLNKEIIRACKENGISTNYFFLALKYFRKIREIVPWINLRK
ncbi:glycosyltransferase family 2 protein [Deinococcus frigens]|uniref:glycosyltransferase family 2 protein n=1 Tax=Deinococcus frigens TaxID=249403 RepID=UPI000A044F43|nr:glycosyltransferase family 2 protein [Deinococcus frigens]